MTRTLPVLTMRTTWATLALWLRVKLNLPENTFGKIVSAIIVTAPFWILGGLWFSAGFFTRSDENRYIVFMVTGLMYIPCTLAIIAAFSHIFSRRR